MVRILRHFGCDYRCGYTGSQKRRVVEHEAQCYSNPATRSCKTCANFDNGSNGDDITPPEPCFCMDESGPETFEIDGRIKLKTDCDLWAPTNQGAG